MLGALDPADRAGFEHHLPGCDACRAELLRLAPLPGLLHRITLADFEDLPEPDLSPADEPARVLELPREKPEPRKRRRLAALAVAAVTVLALGAGVVFVVRSQLPAEPAGVSWSATDPGSGVGVDVELIDRPWGTEVKVTMRDVPPGKPCKLVVRGRDGSKETAGWWSTSPVAGEVIPGSTSIDLAHIATVDIVTADNRILVSVAAPS
ncbi:PROBABLE CONSERVED MEMBRANE PROTEIN [Alloactinosynnema sp. L-07]|nr:PROBABLE CONSERVED MEMBRANE PROTEIN [Alloactinosynnema sp. L-07]